MIRILFIVGLFGLSACTVGANGVATYAGPGTIAQLPSSCTYTQSAFQAAPTPDAVAQCQAQRAAYMAQLQQQIAAQQQQQAAADAQAAQEQAAAAAQTQAQQEAAARQARDKAEQRRVQETSTSPGSSSQVYYDTPDAAQRHCPDDTVVWLNTSSGIYHFAGERWYGHTEDGAYICQRDADSAGDRATENGQ